MKGEPRWTVSIEESTQQGYINDEKAGASYDLGTVESYAEAKGLLRVHCEQTGQDVNELL